MSEIFGVSLDELVKGEGLPKRTEPVTWIPEENQKTPKSTKVADFPLRKKVGTLLLCMAFIEHTPLQIDIRAQIAQPAAPLVTFRPRAV